MTKVILWDFDGVILDSMKVKGNGFIELFKDYDKNYLKKLETYHYKNGGVSRFDKIRYFYENILKKNITENDVIELANKFSIIIEKNLKDKKNLIRDSISFIEKNYKKFNFHIVSGAEHYELNDLCEYFDLSKYFISIEGSPTKKQVLVKKILNKYKYNSDEVIFIGDAMTDYNASKQNNILFYGYNNLELKKFNYIDSFREFHI